MENKSHALAAGAFVLVVTAMLIGLAMWLMRDVANTVTYDMTTETAVTGLQVEAPVRYKGVSVGKVTGIGFDPDEPGNVRVTIAIDPKAPVTNATFASLGFQGVTGLSFVQLDDNGIHSDQALPNGPRGVPRIPLKPNRLGALTDRASDLLEKLSDVTDSLQAILGSENQAALRHALTEMGGAAQSLRQFAANTDKVLQAQFDPSRTNIPALVQQSTKTLQSLQVAAENAGQMTAAWGKTASDAQKTLNALNAPDGALTRLNDSADAIVRSADAVVQSTVPRFETLSDEATRTLGRIGATVDSLGSNPQSLVFGNGPLPPGPGEPGFAPPANAAAQP